MFDKYNAPLGERKLLLFVFAYSALFPLFSPETFSHGFFVLFCLTDIVFLSVDINQCVVIFYYDYIRVPTTGFSSRQAFVYFNLPDK